MTARAKPLPAPDRVPGMVRRAVALVRGKRPGVYCVDGSVADLCGPRGGPLYILLLMRHCGPDCVNRTEPITCENGVHEIPVMVGGVTANSCFVRFRRRFEAMVARGEVTP